jgi:hypothetical protein
MTIMAEASLQEQVDRLADGQTWTLQPALHEFKGPLVLRKPVTLEGQGGTIWAVRGPVVSVESEGVVLRDLGVEVTSRDRSLEGDDACALLVRGGVSVGLEAVSVRGTVIGVADEEGTWSFPPAFSLGALRSSTAHTFCIQLVVPVACRLVSEIDGLEVEPHDLDPGPTTITLRVEALPAGTRLRGQILLHTASLVRRIEVSGHYSDGGAVRAGALLWRPRGDEVEETDSLLDSTPITLPRSGSDPLPRSSTRSREPSGTATAPRTMPVEAPVEEAVLLVAPGEEGAFQTIGEALRQARQGSRILVHPGVYRESLRIARKVELAAAEGVEGEVILESAGAACLRLEAESARVRGLTLRGVSGRREHFAVHASRGQLTLEDCRISSETLACVVASGAGATVHLRRCRIRSGASAGVLASGRGEVIVEDSEVTEQTLAGVEARRGGVVVLRHSRLTAGQQAGILVHDQGKVTGDGSEITAQMQAGAEVREGGELQLRRCKVRQNRGPGVHVHHDARATLEDCDLADNGQANLEVCHLAEATLRRCQLRQAEQAGALFGRDARGTLEDCQLTGNAGPAVEVREGANPTLRRCTARGSGPVALVVRDQGRGTFEECDLAEADLAVLDLRQGAGAVLRRCKIHDGKKAGVLASSRAAARLEECEVFDNQGPGVAILDGANPTLTRCRIHDNGLGGVVVGRGGRGVLDGSEVEDNELSGLVVNEGAAPVARSCRFCRNRDLGVWAGRGAQGEVESCDLTGNRNGSLEVESGAELQKANNRTDE